jgi:flagellar basal body-associated protein FliL
MPSGTKAMRRATIVMLIFAILVGILSAVATYKLITSSQHDHKVDRGSDSPGQLF